MDVKVPQLGESIMEATVARWLKKPGDVVHMDEPIAELETDKINIEVSAPVAGILTKQKFKEEDTVEVGVVIAVIDETAKVPSPAPKKKDSKEKKKAASSPGPMPNSPQNKDVIASPSAQKIAKEKNITLSSVTGTGKDGRVTKEDVMAFGKPAAAPEVYVGNAVERVKLSRLRQRIAERLKEAQNTAAVLTTFNEIDMSAVMSLRKRHKEAFEKKYGVKLGFMSFFTKAVVSALHKYPSVNAEIEGTDVLFKNFYNIGVAVGTDKGLVVPVLKNAETLEYAEIESKIAHYAQKARDGQLSIEDLSGGTFTISNGGTYGSLLSTPILNFPQSGILGLHKIEERPVVVNGEIVIRPMMYVALSYDHRLIDGKEAVGFLVAVKEFIEDPPRLLLNI